MNTKFNPKDVPSSTRWIAVDRSGACWGYSSEPDNDRIIDEWWPPSNKTKCVPLYYGSQPKNWKDELYQWV